MVNDCDCVPEIKRLMLPPIFCLKPNWWNAFSCSSASSNRCFWRLIVCTLKFTFFRVWRMILWPIGFFRFTNTTFTLIITKLRSIPVVNFWLYSWVIKTAVLLDYLSPWVAWLLRSAHVLGSNLTVRAKCWIIVGSFLFSFLQLGIRYSKTQRMFDLWV